MSDSSKAGHYCSEHPDTPPWRDWRGRGSYCGVCGAWISRYCKVCDDFVPVSKMAAERAGRWKCYCKPHYKVVFKARGWSANRPQIDRRRSALRRAVMELHGSHTEAEWLALLQARGGRCLACGSAENITRDHIIPLSRGGTDTIENIQPLCQPCNASKYTKVIDYR